VTRPNRSDCATTNFKKTSAKNARKLTNLTNQMQKEKKSKCLNYVTSSNVTNPPTLTHPPKETVTSAKQNIFSISLSSHLNISYACISSWGPIPEKKNSCSFLFCPNYLSLPPSPQFGQLIQLFSDVELQDLEEIDSFY